jgi:hypothetical protein
MYLVVQRYVETLNLESRAIECINSTNEVFGGNAQGVIIQ